jgi:hypothetical protein
MAGLEISIEMLTILLKERKKKRKKEGNIIKDIISRMKDKAAN